MSEIINNNTVDSDGYKPNKIEEFSQGTDPCLAEKKPEPPGPERDFVLEGILSGLSEKSLDPYALVCSTLSSVVTAVGSPI